MNGSWLLRATLAVMALLTLGMLYGIWSAEAPASRSRHLDEPVDARDLARRIEGKSRAAPTPLPPPASAGQASSSQASRSLGTGEPSVNPGPAAFAANGALSIERLPRTPKDFVASVTPPPTLGQTGPRLSHSRARLGFARSAVGSAVSEDRRIRLLPVKRRAEEAMEARLSGTEASFEATRRVERDAFVEKLDAQGRRHRLYLDTAEHLVYEPPDARSIVVAPYHSVAAFNFELDQNANVHIAWYQDRDRQLHYVWLVPMEDGSFAVHSEAVLGSPDEPTSISVTLSAMGVKVEYQTAAAVGYYRIDPQRPTERIAWESRND